MNCLECGGATEVLDTEKFPLYVWRKRRCLKCNHRMITHENFAHDVKTSRTKKVIEEQPVVEVQPLPVRNVRTQIEDIKEYLEYRQKEQE